jgi:3-deoxy-D-manno-octulosonate 8-phosphate phosphatase (KDO 8-P phosphatase)
VNESLARRHGLLFRAAIVSATMTSKRVIPEGWKPRMLVLDVDGVLTNGQFVYTAEGKVAKVFGPDDHDGLLLVKSHLDIVIITGDRKGFEITKKRVADDMKLRLELVSTVQRAKWFKETMNPRDAIYMADGIFDAFVFPHVGYAIAPANAFQTTKERADHVTRARGGDRAVAEACLHVMERFFTPFDPDHPPAQFSGSGEWSL